MADVSLLFKPTQTKIDELVLDCTITESHTSDVEVTEHPVEEGANIVDHARVKPASISLEGVFTNTPLNETQLTRVIESFGATFETTSTEATTSGQAGRAEEAFAKLNEMKNAAKLVTVVTGLKVYKNMLLTSLSVPRDAKTGEALRFSATFKEVRLVKNKTSQETVTREPKAKAKTSSGKQPNKEGSAAKEKSWLKGLSDNTGLTGYLVPPN